MRELCPWYALTVKHQHEVAVRSALEFKGFEALAPTYRARRRWSDRIKEIRAAAAHQGSRRRALLSFR
jgi:hypothetical protein